MLIELAEYLKCGNDHPEAPLVIATGAMKERAIVFGTIGCPVCKAEYTIVNRIARFGSPAESPPPPPPPSLEPSADVEAVQALLGLTSPGGYVVLLGSAGMLAAGLTGVMENVHFVGVNPPEQLEPMSYMSLLRGAKYVPLRSAMARGVVVGAEHAAAPWLDEASRVLLKGQRLVVLREGIEPSGLTKMMSAAGLWAGEKN